MPAVDTRHDYVMCAICPYMVYNKIIILPLLLRHCMMVMSDQCACAGNTDRRFSGVVNGPAGTERNRTIESHRL